MKFSNQNNNLGNVGEIFKESIKYTVTDTKHKVTTGEQTLK